MKVEIHIDPALKRPKVVICAPAATAEIQALARRLAGAGAALTFPAFRGSEALLLPLGDILRFFADGKGVSCQTAGGVYAVRQRLYELEQELEDTRFVRVSHSEIVNLDKVSALDLSLTGTIKLTLEGNVTVYVSRRYVKRIKQVLGLGRGHEP